MVRQLIYGGIRTRDYRCIVDGSETYVAPEREYETVSVPGRNGDLTIDNGRYSNVELKYTAKFRTAREMEMFRERITALAGYQRLEDNKRPDEYRQARLRSLSPSMSGVENRYATVELVFDCMPQRFLKTGEQPLEFTAAATLVNPWSVASQPLIRIYGTGTVKIGESSVVIAPHPKDYVDIDCEMGDAYCGPENLNKYVTRGASYPLLTPGPNAITLTGVTKIIVYPRWWHL